MRSLIVTLCVLPSGAVNHQRRVLLRFDTAFQTFDIECLVADKLQRLCAVAAEKLQRQHAHADQVAAMNALEAARDRPP